MVVPKVNAHRIYQRRKWPTYGIANELFMNAPFPNNIAEMPSARFKWFRVACSWYAVPFNAIMTNEIGSFPSAPSCKSGRKKKNIHENCNFIYKLICMQIDALVASGICRWIAPVLFILDWTTKQTPSIIRSECEIKTKSKMSVPSRRLFIHLFQRFYLSIANKVEMNTNRNL